jgi:LacI family transcriptional regulator
MIAISIDYGSGIDQAVQHLAVLGHRKIAFIAGPGQLHSAVLRRTAFQRSLTRIGVRVPKSYVPEGDHTLEGGIKAMEKLIRNKNLPTAIVCSNDMTAIGVMHAAAAANLRIPEDLSIVGFDDIHMARYMIPPLTSVQMSCRDLAYEAFTALRSQLEGEGSTQKTVYHVSTRLSVRQTTGYPRDSVANLPASAASTKRT